MKKLLSLSFTLLLMCSLFAQENPETSKKKKINLSGRANDHLLLQLGYTGWAGIPDSINNGGLSKRIYAFFMFDFSFKTNPKLSICVGAGVATDQNKFSKNYVGIKNKKTTLPFIDASDTNYFKKK